MGAATVYAPSHLTPSHLTTSHWWLGTHHAPNRPEAKVVEARQLDSAKGHRASEQNSTVAVERTRAPRFCGAVALCRAVAKDDPNQTNSETHRHLSLPRCDVVVARCDHYFASDETTFASQVD